MAGSTDLKNSSEAGLRKTLSQSKIKSKAQGPIANVMVSKVLTINPENSLYEAAQIMGERHIGSLICLKYGTPVGIITEGDIIGIATKGIPLQRGWISSSPSIRTEKVEKVMSSPLVKICVDNQLKDAARAMLENRVQRLGVCDSGKLVGIVTTSDMVGRLPRIPEVMEPFFEVDNFMSRQVVTAGEESLLEEVALTMAEKHVGSVIVTSKGEPVGIFTERDLLSKFLAEGESLIEEVGNVCSSPLISAPIGVSVHSASEIMMKKHIKRLPITKDNKIVGVISARDLVEAYARG